MAAVVAHDTVIADGKCPVSQKVIVVGAGISGIAAAKTLCTNGCTSVTVLEASHRAGGRLLTTNISGIPVELGATYIHGTENNVIFDLGKRYGLITGINVGKDYSMASVYLSNGVQVPREHLLECWEQFLILIEEHCDTYPDLHSYMLAEYPKRMAMFASTREAMNTSYWQSLFEIMLSDYSSDEGKEHSKGVAVIRDFTYLPGEASTVFDNGCTFGGLVDRLVEELPKDAILFGREVVSIDTRGERALVKCRNGDQFEADHVVVTVSLGVLKKRCLEENLLPNEQPLFVPALSAAKQKAIRNLGFGKLGKLIIEFDPKITGANISVIFIGWLPEQKNDEVIKKKFPWLTSIYGLEKIQDSHLYLSWVTGSIATQLEATPEEDIVEGFAYLFEKVLNHPVLRRPVAVHMYKWSSDPLILGCYTADLLPVNEARENRKILGEPLDNLKVLFAGEAVHSIYYSTMHGAHMTGTEAAGRLLYNYK